MATGTFDRLTRLQLTGVLLIACAHCGQAQDSSPPARPQFEVASIKPNTDGNPNKNIGVSPGGRVRVTDLPVRFLIRFAFNVQDFQISGGPGWMNADGYDINAKAPENITLQQARPYLQSLLEDRFKLVLHHQTKDVPVFELLEAKGGLKIAPSKDGSCVVPDPKNLPRPGEPLPHFCGNSSYRPNLIEVYAVPMQRFVALLSTVLGRTVIDKSGVTGLVDIHLEFTPDEISTGAANDPAPQPAAADSSKPSIFVAIQEQLGLRLQATKGPGDLLVIDHLERPSEN
jgi:uncharacterized protein (TIGR03435 family)